MAVSSRFCGVLNAEPGGERWPGPWCHEREREARLCFFLQGAGGELGKDISARQETERGRTDIYQQSVFPENLVDAAGKVNDLRPVWVEEQLRRNIRKWFRFGSCWSPSLGWPVHLENFLCNLIARGNIPVLNIKSDCLDFVNKFSNSDLVFDSF